MSYEAKANAWQKNRHELVQVTNERFVNRRDRHGCYKSSGGCFTSHDQLTATKIASHFAGRKTIGLLTTSTEDTCRWLAIDLDNHEEDPEVAARNFNSAIRICKQLDCLDVTWLLEDSDGQGGYHIWVPFSESVPAKVVHRFGKYLVGDAVHEVFPKQSRRTGMIVGNWLRFPGRHHKRDHWSRFWGDGEWMDAEQSVGQLLSVPMNDPAFLHQLPEEEPKPQCVDAVPPSLTYPIPSAKKCESIVDAAERYFEAMSWPDLLTQQGWKRNADLKDDKSEWTRPGKDFGTSATLNFDGNNRLHVFSANAGMPQGQSYGKFRFLLHSRGYNDQQQVAAAKALLPPPMVAENDRQWRAAHGKRRIQNPGRTSRNQSDASGSAGDMRGKDKLEASALRGLHDGWPVSHVLAACRERCATHFTSLADWEIGQAVLNAAWCCDNEQQERTCSTDRRTPPE